MNNNSLSIAKISVAIAIIHQKDRYLMQLRDDIPTIIHPGVWGLFGGHLELGEEPAAGLKRELIEEIDYHADELTEFGCYADSKIVRYAYSCPLLVPIEDLTLYEGWDFGLLTPEEIHQGYAYSAQAGEKRLLGDTHRQIMLDFIETQA